VWPFRRQPAAPEAEKAVLERLDDIEDGMQHLNRRFTRLQQQVTRWAREYDLEDDTDEDDFDDLLEQKRRERA